MTYQPHKGLRAAGWVLHALVGGMMLFAGSGKVFGFAPAAIVKNLSDHGLGQRVALIGAGEFASALLLLVPLTMSLGLLLTSAFWGGAICFHMATGTSFVFPSVLLLLTWAGAFLRDPRTFASFLGAASVPVENGPRPVTGG